MRPEYDFSKGERGKFFHADARLILPASVGAQDWAGPEGDLGAYITEESRRTITAYANQPHLVLEHANLEQDTARGGYAHRQLFELVQNGADALSGASEGGHIAIRLTDDCLYCADDGQPINRDGVTALMFSHMSPKRGTSEIGRFGLGFKSVLGVTDAPEFFSRAGSFRFDRQRARERIREVAPDTERWPVLRVADPVDPSEARDSDPVLLDFMSWATNIVRLPLAPRTAVDLRDQMHGFPAEFLLFAEHVRELRLNDHQSTLGRTIELQQVDNEVRLVDGGRVGHWRLFHRMHSLPADAQADRRSLDDGDEVPIWWAAPLDSPTEPRARKFWAFFPTDTSSLMAGILNAPWKTNEDRKNLLRGPYNDELIAAAAGMIADVLPQLATTEDPARHLDALPRRHEADDSEQSDQLRQHLLSKLCDREIVPDQDGALCTVRSISYQPREVTSDGPVKERPLARWRQCPGRPSNWLHHRAITRNRLHRIEQLQEQWLSAKGQPRYSLPWHAPISKWLHALVSGKSGSDAIEASRAAIATAAALSPELRHPKTLGEIVLMQNEGWNAPDPERVFLPSTTEDADLTSDAGQLVLASLALDDDTRQALCELGLRPVSAGSRFAHVASRFLGEVSPPMLESDWRRFWRLAREVETVTATDTITSHQNWRARLHVRTQAETWVASHGALLPGSVVPGSNDQDQQVAIDLEFHGEDVELLKSLGIGRPSGRPRRIGRALVR